MHQRDEVRSVVIGRLAVCGGAGEHAARFAEDVGDLLRMLECVAMEMACDCMKAVMLIARGSRDGVPLQLNVIKPTHTGMLICSLSL